MNIAEPTFTQRGLLDNVREGGTAARLFVRVALLLDKSDPGRQAFTLPVLIVGKRVIASIDRHAAVDPNQLVAKRNFVIRQGFEGVDYVVSNGFRIVAALGRQGSPEYRLAIVER